MYYLAYVPLSAVYYTCSWMNIYYFSTCVAEKKYKSMAVANDDISIVLFSTDNYYKKVSYQPRCNVYDTHQVNKLVL